MLHHAGMRILFLIHSLQLMDIFNGPRVLFVMQHIVHKVWFFKLILHAYVFFIFTVYTHAVIHQLKLRY